ncbi:MAG: hypothetical protein V3V08_11455, partial [Nannocystaceae bacterium]
MSHPPPAPKTGRAPDRDDAMDARMSELLAKLSDGETPAEDALVGLDEDPPPSLRAPRDTPPPPTAHPATQPASSPASSHATATEGPPSVAPMPLPTPSPAAGSPDLPRPARRLELDYDRAGARPSTPAGAPTAPTGRSGEAS